MSKQAANKKATFALIALLVAAALLSVSYAGYNALKDFQDKRRNEQMAGEIVAILEQTLKEATKVEVAPEDGKPANSKVIRVQDGQLYLDDTLLYEKTLEHQRKVTWSVTASRISMQLQIHILNEDGLVLAKKSGEIWMNNLQLFHRTIEGETRTSVVNPQISFEEDMTS